MNSFCPCCSSRKDSSLMIELICDHDLCFQCAEKIKIPEGVSPLDAKFRICCPTCKRNTTTLNISNLIKQQNDKMLFANGQSSEISEEQFQQSVNPHKLSQSKLRKMSYTERRSNVYADRKTPEATERASKASHDSRHDSKRNTANKSRPGQNIFEVKCHQHKQPLMFYCEFENMVMCMQCMYRHMQLMKDQKAHQVCSLSDAIPIITSQNKNFKIEAKKKIEEIDKCISICKGNKVRIDQVYQIHEQLIDTEFRALEELIRKKERETKEFLQKHFKKKQKELADQMNDLSYLKGCLKEHYEYSIDSPNSQLYFFNAYNTMRVAINKVSTNYAQIKHEDLACFEKLTSKDDFEILLQKFFRPKGDGRESKNVRKQNSNAPSRGNSEKGTQPKQFIDDVKKKLDKLNKMQNQHKEFKVKDKKQDYLGNYVIEEISKKDLQGSGFGYFEKNGTPNPLNYRKSSASEYTNDKKPQKALTPTRLASATQKIKKKQAR